MTVQSQVIAVRIERPYDEVYALLAEPWNFPKWASGLAEGLEQDGEVWRAEGPGGRVSIRFSEPNAFGVADHWVTLADGREVYIPLRAISSGDGTEVQFTLLRQPDMDDETFARDADWIRRDLDALKRLAEN